MERTRIGIDLAKNFFHLVAMDSRGKILWRKALTRRRVLEFLAKSSRVPWHSGTENTVKRVLTSHKAQRVNLRPGFD
jgi:hypothetical protein